MKRHFAIIAFIGFVMLFASSCTNTKQKNCEIDLVMVDYPSDGKLADETISVLLPFKMADNSIVLPQGNLLGDSVRLSYIKPKSWLEKIRGGMTKNTTLMILSEKIKKHLSTLELTPLKGAKKADKQFIDKISANYDLVCYLAPQNTATASQNHFSNSIEFIKYLSDSAATKDDVKILLVMGKLGNTAPLPAPPLETVVDVIPDKPDVAQQQVATPVVQPTPYTIEDCFEKLADVNIAYEAKGKYKADLLQYFTANATVVRVNNNQEILTGRPLSVTEYAESVCSTHKAVAIVDRQYQGNKIIKLKVREL